MPSTLRSVSCNAKPAIMPACVEPVTEHVMTVSQEVADQEQELGAFFDTVITCSVTGSTQAGMIAGFALQDTERQGLGIDGSATVEQTWNQIVRIARQTAEAIGLGRACVPGSRACSPILCTKESRWL